MKIAGLRTLATCLIGLSIFSFLADRHAYRMLNYQTAGERTASPEALQGWAKIQTLFQGVTVPRPVSSMSPQELHPDAQDLTIPVNQDIPLSAWYVPAPPGQPLIVLFHGYTAEKTSGLPEARIAMELGYAVMLVDHRGSGGSSESYTTLGYLEAEDVTAAYQFAKASLPHARIYLRGFSMGAAAVARAVHEGWVEPEGVILEAMFARLQTTIGRRFTAMGLPAFPGTQALIWRAGRQFGFNAFAHNPEDYVTSIHCPTLYMAGSEDPRATPSAMEHMARLTPGPSSFIIAQGVGHTSFAKTSREQYKSALKAFVTQEGLIEAVPKGTAP